MLQKVSWVFYNQICLHFQRIYEKRFTKESFQRISENVILKDSEGIELSFSNRFSSQRKHLVLQYIHGFWRYSVVSIKRTGCNKRTGWSKIFLVHEKKNRVVQNFFLVHEKKVQGGKKLQNS